MAASINMDRLLSVTRDMPPHDRIDFFNYLIGSLAGTIGETRWVEALESSAATLERNRANRALHYQTGGFGHFDPTNKKASGL